MRERLGTVRGQLTLLAAGFLGAAVLAVVLAAHRGFFEGLVREKYPAPSRAAEELARRGEAGGPAYRADLYHCWMRGDEEQSALPRVLMETDPEFYASRVERTLAAGSRAQKLRAVLFARLSGHERMEPVLAWGLRRARAVRDDELAEAIRR